jgi:hypothetical protein
MPKMSTTHPQPHRRSSVAVTTRGRAFSRRRTIGVPLGTALLGAAIVAVVLLSMSGNSIRSPARASDATAVTPPPDPDRPPVSLDPLAPGQPVAAGLDQSDPYLMVATGTYYLYTSGRPGLAPVNVPVAASTDFANWGPVTDALPTLPSWARPGYTWAPDVHRFGSTYLLYFTAMLRDVSPSTECIGVSFGTRPTGPFVPLPTPFICQLDQGGSIDPRVFTDAGGTRWMLWKSDQNIGGASTPTKLWSQPLAPDGLSLTGRPSVLLQPDEAWQGTIVEAPQLVEIQGAYWVFYSANWFNQPGYGMGAARCAGPAGPCADTSTLPLLGSNLQGLGPGEESVFTDGSGLWLLYSPWRSLAPHPDFPPRPVYIARLGMLPAGPYLASLAAPPSLGPLSAATVWSGTP